MVRAAATKFTGIGSGLQSVSLWRCSLTRRASGLWRMSKWLNVMWIKHEIIIIRELQQVQALFNKYARDSAYLFQMFNQIRMLVRNMLLDERSRLKKFLTSLTPKFSLVLLLDEWLSRFAQLSAATGKKTILRRTAACQGTYSS